MTLDEIRNRESRLNAARQKVSDCIEALESARDEYAEQEANKVGIFYGKTKVQYRGAVFFVYGRSSFMLERPVYNLARVKKDGTMAKRPSSLLARLADLTIISEDETP